MDKSIKDIIKAMTLEEKAALTSGLDNWQTKGVERLNVPKVWMSDGPNGLRKEIKQEFVVNESHKAVTYPTAVTVACSFNEDILYTYGEALGKEATAQEVAILLGPALNIKRSPLCGRNFEYLSEDPYLSGKLTQAFIKGIQSQNVGACVKHFACNNQEYHRMVNSSEVDERTLREIYLTGFEIAIKEGKPWAVMSAYNKINGIHASQNKKLLTDILRKEWKYEGMVMSDWCAVNNRVEAIEAGCNLTMPTDTRNDHLLVEAVNAGKLDVSLLDESCERVLELTHQYHKNYQKKSVSIDELDQVSQMIAEESIVLLKNNGALPLSKEDNLLFVGPFVKNPRILGGGSAQVNAYQITSLFDVMPEMNWLEGYSDLDFDRNDDLKTEVLIKAKNYDKVIVFAGLPEIYESEGFDRLNLDMPDYQNQLIDELGKIHSNVTVVLHNGSVIRLPWEDKVNAIVGCHLGGEAVGRAIHNILFGHISPSGRLAETWPKRLEDTPTYLSYLGKDDKTEYREGVFVGYRYYETKNIDVQYPFGYGLSYSQFSYSNLSLSQQSINANDDLIVTVDITNKGTITAKEVIQLYVSLKQEGRFIDRPIRELKAFDKIELKPNETKTVTFVLNQRSFAYWNTVINNWHVLEGTYQIQICRNASEVILEKDCFINSVTVHEPLTLNAPIDVLAKTALGAKFLESHEHDLKLVFGKYYSKEEDRFLFTSEMEKKVISELYLYSKSCYTLLQFIPKLELSELIDLVDQINQKNQ